MKRINHALDEDTNLRMKHEAKKRNCSVASLSSLFLNWTLDRVRCPKAKTIRAKHSKA